MSSTPDVRIGRARLRFAQRWALGLAFAGLTLSACTSVPTAASPATSASSLSTSSNGGSASATTRSAGLDESVVSTANPATTTPTSTDSHGDLASNTTSEEPERTTAVPPPAGNGDINKTVPSRAVATKPAVALTATAVFGARVTASIVGVESIDAKAEAPGEISGAGVALTVKIVNGSAKTIGLGLVTVNLIGSDGAPRSQITTDPARPFTGSLSAGKSASAVYVFTIPASLRKPMTVSVSYTSDTPVLLFRGTPT